MKKLRKKIRKKTLLYLVISISFLAVALALSALLFDKVSDKRFNETDSIEQDFHSALAAAPGFDVTFKGSAGDIVGHTNKSSFEGSLEKNGAKTKLISLSDTSYISSDGTWSENKDAFSYEMNLIKHPEYIQLENRLDDVVIDGVTYLQYQILFEKPNQKIIDEIPKSRLEQIRLYGTALINKNTLELKQEKLHIGKNSSATAFTLEYSELATAPTINAPVVAN